ncbi:MAG: WhiB family transcriptional regulator [Acidimicrobiaceae bacterium]|nr:WhiB family transcriptional regulator [Acidimicrobiaceae bacterium]
MSDDGDFREWQAKAACRGPQAAAFYPPASGERRDEKRLREREAKEICAHCAVAGRCLEMALASREAYGIWGGTNESERRVLIEA